MLKKIALVCACALAPFATSASQLPDYPFIHVSSTAAQYVMPDIGTLDFEVVASDADPGAARAVVETRVAEVRALAEGLGLPEEDVEVRDVRQEIRKGDTAVVAPVYDLRCVVHLNVRDLSKWRAIAGGLAGKPNLDAFSTAFDTSEREKVEMDLAAQAIRDARRRGEAIAAGFGRKLGPVTAVTGGALKNLAQAMGLAPALPYARGNEQKVQPVDPRELVNIIAFPLAQSVDVIFRIK